ncbi:hypothetical protein C8F01DRAFT_1247936 [Mycena amicta]|nr:hypothetical protein C8F01DRAFT_1247936 [Mycena amicta]
MFSLGIDSGVLWTHDSRCMDTWAEASALTSTPSSRHAHAVISARLATCMLYKEHLVSLTHCKGPPPPSWTSAQRISDDTKPRVHNVYNNLDELRVMDGSLGSKPCKVPLQDGQDNLGRLQCNVVLAQLDLHSPLRLWHQPVFTTRNAHRTPSLASAAPSARLPRWLESFRMRAMHRIKMTVQANANIGPGNDIEQGGWCSRRVGAGKSESGSDSRGYSSDSPCNFCVRFDGHILLRRFLILKSPFSPACLSNVCPPVYDRRYRQRCAGRRPLIVTVKLSSLPSPQHVSPTFTPCACSLMPPTSCWTLPFDHYSQALKSPLSPACLSNVCPPVYDRRCRQRCAGRCPLIITVKLSSRPSTLHVPQTFAPPGRRLTMPPMLGWTFPVILHVLMLQLSGVVEGYPGQLLSVV